MPPTHGRICSTRSSCTGPPAATIRTNERASSRTRALTSSRRSRFASTVDAYALLGYIALALRSELPEAETALLKASELAPGREELRLALADVMIGNGEDLAARATLTLLRNVTYERPDP